MLDHIGEQAMQGSPERVSTLLITASIEAKPVLAAWAREQGLRVVGAGSAVPCRPAAVAVVSARDVAPDWVRRVAFETPVVLVELDHSSDAFAYYAAGATDVVHLGASAEDMVQRLQARLQAREIPLGDIQFCPTTCTLRRGAMVHKLQHAPARVLLCLWRDARPVHTKEIRRDIESASRGGGAVRTHIWALRRALASIDPRGRVRIRSEPPGRYVLDVEAEPPSTQP